MIRSAFDSFVILDKTHGAISTVYAEGRYIIFTEFLNNINQNFKKNIKVIFYDDIKKPLSIQFCHYYDDDVSDIKTGYIFSENSDVNIREWMSSVRAISSTWQTPVVKIKKWYSELMEIYPKRQINVSNLFQSSRANFYTLSNSASASYNWAKYKLSQLEISCYSLHI